MVHESIVTTIDVSASTHDEGAEEVVSGESNEGKAGGEADAGKQIAAAKSTQDSDGSKVVPANQRTLVVPTLRYNIQVRGGQ